MEATSSHVNWQLSPRLRDVRSGQWEHEILVTEEQVGIKREINSVQSLRRTPLTSVLATDTCCHATRRDRVAHPPVAEGASKTEVSTQTETPSGARRPNWVWILSNTLTVRMLNCHFICNTASHLFRLKNNHPLLPQTLNTCISLLVWSSDETVNKIIPLTTTLYNRCTSIRVA